MAQRRMFSLKIVDTDAFLEMPPSSQLLYFHLAMRADDDGFIGNPKRIMRMLGSAEDDFKVLLAKRFIIPFDSGVCVIKHWRMHNYIQNDRYNPTPYLEEKNSLDIKDNGAYTERKQNVYIADTQVRLGKDRLGKDTEAAQDAADDKGEGALINTALEGFKGVNPSYSRLYANKTQRAAMGRMLKAHGLEKMQAVIAYLPTSNAARYAPTITTPLQLESKLGDLFAWAQKQRDTGKGKPIIF